MSPMKQYFGNAATDELLARWPKAELLDHGRLLSALCWTFTNPTLEDEIIKELLGHIAALTEENQALKARHETNMEQG